MPASEKTPSSPADGKTDAKAARGKFRDFVRGLFGGDDDRGDPQAGGPRNARPQTPAATTPRCEMCQGLGIVPKAGRKRLVHVEGDAEPEAADWVPWQPCPVSARPGHAQELAAEATRLWKAAADKHVNWEKRIERTLLCVRTPHMMIHAQMPREEAIELGNVVEDLAIHLQETTRSCVLTLTRQHTLGVIALKDQGEYDKVIAPARGWKEFSHVKDWSLNHKLQSAWAREADGGLTVLEERGTSWREHCLALFALGTFPDAPHGSVNRDKDWLSAGFYYYCQQAILKRVFVSVVDYLETETPRENDWHAAAGRALAEGEFRPWNELFDYRLESLTPSDHLACFSIVSYLIKHDGPKFARFVAAVRFGAEQIEALEAAYGKTVAELESDWRSAVKADHDRANLLAPTKKPKRAVNKEAKAGPVKKETPEEIIERRAAGKLDLGKSLLSSGKTEAAKKYFREIISMYPATKAAGEAKKLLEMTNTP